MFPNYTVLVREICNGIMFVSAVLLIMIFVDYIFRSCQSDRDCFRDSAIQAAISLIILMLGHAIRAFTGWMQWLSIRNEWATDIWIDEINMFLVATVLIVLGKDLMIYTFTPYRWGWRLGLAIGAAVVAITIPVLVAILTT